MRKILLKKMKINNFKIEGIRQIDFQEGLNEIIGDNSTGKSTIADAFCYAFLGRDQWGASRQEYITKGRSMTTIEVKYENEESNFSNLTKRLAYENENKKTKTYVTLNGRNSKTTEVAKMFDTDLFLSIVNPKYFQNLSPAKAKDILITLADFENKDVFPRMKIEDVEILDGEKFSIKTIGNLKTSKNKIIKGYETDILLLKEKLKSLEGELAELIIPDELEVKKEEGIDDVVNQIALGLIDVEEGMNLIEKAIHIRNNNQLRAERITRRKEILEEISALEKDIELIIEVIDKNKNFVKSLDNFKDVYLELVNEKIGKEMKHASIRLKDYTTEGEEKTVFELEYKGKELKTCSNAEQYKAGLEFSKMLMKFSGYTLPIFIDNAETVSSFSEEEFEGVQVVTLSVSKGYKLSKIEDDIVIDVETLETMPRIKEVTTVHRVIGDYF